MKFSFFALTGLALMLPAVAQAQSGSQYPWCAQYGGNGDGGRNCGFTTFQQCQATVSGIGGFCERNTFYIGPSHRKHKTSDARY